LAATQAKVLGAMDTLFAEEIARLTQRRVGLPEARTGSTGCPPRFGGSLNVHPHLHTLAVDGVFEKLAPFGFAQALAEPIVIPEPTTLPVAPWGRLADGELFARARSIAWAVLIKRTWGFAVLTWPRCGWKRRVLSTITDPTVVRTLLEHLRVRSTPRPRAPARDPTGGAGRVASRGGGAPRRPRDPLGERVPRTSRHRCAEKKVTGTTCRARARC
jgi:hypothetical protein